MKKLYTSFLIVFCTLFSNLLQSQFNSNYGNLLPLVNAGDEWPFDHVKGFVHDMKVIEDSLYVVGIFDTFNGMSLGGIFKWDGQEVSQINTPFLLEYGSNDLIKSIHCINTYENRIVVGIQQIDSPSVVYEYDGVTWNQLGGSLGNVLINDLIEWNGELYCVIQANNSILKLNEMNEWENFPAPISGVKRDMEVNNGKLYVLSLNNGAGEIWVNDGSGFEQLFADFELFDSRYFSFQGSELFAFGTFDNGQDTGSVLRFDGVESELLYGNLGVEIKGMFSLGGTNFLLDEGSSPSFILDESGANRGAYKLSGFVDGIGGLCHVVYKGRAFFPGDVVYSTPNSPEKMGLLTFEPRAMTSISNTSQEFIKPYLFGVIERGAPSNSIGTIPSLFSHLDLEASPVYQSGINICAKVGNEQVVNAHTWFARNSNWFPGPLTENYTIETYRNYNRVWKVTQAEIDAHISGVGQSGYIMPSSIADWPGNGNFGNGESHMLAPFHDENQNTWYEPDLGDYPIIRGKEAMFWVQHGKPTLSIPDAIQVDLHVMAYLEEGEGLNDLALFFHNVIVNRSNLTYDSLRIGLFNDFDLGNSADDFIGSDSLLATAYVYNGDDFDEPSPSNHYGSEVPAFGCVFLSEAMEANTYWNIGMNPVNGDPETVGDYYNYMNGRYKTGSFIIPGQAWAPSGPMMFQDSPCGQGTENEVDLGNPPADRRLLSAGEVHTLHPNESLCFDFAYYFKPNTGDNIETLCAFLEDIPAIHNFYQDKNYNCTYVNNIEEEDLESRFRAFPNPCVNSLNIDLTNVSSGQQMVLRIIDTQGRVVLTEPINQAHQLIALDVSEISSGVYSVVLFTGKEQLTQLLVKE